VDVALHGGHQDLAARLLPAAFLLGVHERLEVGHGALHDARALDHLREEHLAAAEEVAHHGHAVHQRPLDDVERLRQLRARLLGVHLDEVVMPFTSAWRRRSRTSASRQARSSTCVLPAPFTTSRPA
jgi:hypothetical protein